MKCYTDREKEVKKLFKTIEKNSVSIALDNTPIDTSDYLLVKAENSSLKIEINKLEEQIKLLKKEVENCRTELNSLREKTKHNARNAGRKKMYLTDKFKTFVKLYEQKLTLEEICSRMHISLRSAYYYRKEYQIYKSFEDNKKQRY